MCDDEFTFTRVIWKRVGSKSDDDSRRDTQLHVMTCPGYEIFRQDKDIVEYFRQVIKHRLDETAATCD